MRGGLPARVLLSLNHFHKPITESLADGFAASVTRATQNMTHEGWLYTLLSGGLNFHIEHHLFSTMPRRNYRVVAPEVRAFCARHGLEYSTSTFGQALRALAGKLDAPYGARPVADTVESGGGDLEDALESGLGLIASAS